MTNQLPTWLERLVERLIPPAAREPIAGDLHERFRSITQYAAEAFRLIPFVVFSQIRRTADPQILTILGGGVLAAFLAALWWLNDLAFLRQPAALLSLAVIPLTVTAVGAISTAYAPPRRSRLRQLLEGVLTVALALLVYNLLIRPVPASAMSISAQSLGARIAVIFLVCARWFLPTRQPALTPVDPANAGIPELARRLHRRVVWRNAREYLAALVVLLMVGAGNWHNPVDVPRVPSALIVAGVIYVIVQLRRRGKPQPLPRTADPSLWRDVYQSELIRQRDLLRGIWTWYLLPLIPGLVSTWIFSFAGHKNPDWNWLLFSIAAAAILFSAVAALNRRAARKLQQQLDALNP